MDKHQIENALKNFYSSGLTDASIKLFETLGYNTSRNAPLPTPDYGAFSETFQVVDTRFRPDRARTDKWDYVDLLFQITNDEIGDTNSLFENIKVNNTLIESYLFITVGLKEKNYTRTVLSEITREINRIFPMPVLVLFRYDNLLTLSIIDRRINKTNSDRDVLEKVTLIKDIDILSPHRAHIEILYDLSFQELYKKYQFTNFVKLHESWQITLDTKTLSKKFFDELADWFFWAHDKVTFPNDRNLLPKNNIQISLIRLVTRMIFVWFLKEKKLVPETLFDQNYIKNLLKGFNPDSSKSSVFYNAILQNLFFATLNQKMTERKFASEGDFEENKKEYGVKTLFRHANLFTKDREFVLSLFKDIPFLNGGLFDCLDKTGEDSGKILYTDGFTRKPEKSAKVPDLLFWGKEDNADLTEFYGNERKNRKCRGLLNIFSGYKFTIEENTPIEEEIALDPELLGKVFENLLAFYNPETASTARKSTGSFYTPREIVNYMVDESLIAYLKTKLLEYTPEGSAPNWHSKEQELEDNIRVLVGYNAVPHAFTDDEIWYIIQCIDKIKVLDPACGSGAFPMGILHKLVYILGKLDPENIKWRELQKQKALKETDSAFDLTEQIEREQRLQEINEAFGNNASDFGRKLYLIENCIYGVDIQPIAVQISKLRFFISLLVDQKENPQLENRGIRALPNLETKFVAANTLIGLNATDSPVIVPNEVVDLEEDMKKLRNKHFLAKTYKEKMHLQKEDKATRQLIASKLEAVGFPPESARKISNYDIYDQMASSDWFDPEWMFGVSSGFDVVIGNPPYVVTPVSEYKNYEWKGDLYYLFFENGLKKLLQSKGVLSFITPRFYLFNMSCEKLRRYLLEKTRIYSLVECDPFEAITENVITTVQNINYKNDYLNIFTFKEQSLILLNRLSVKNILVNKFCEINPNLKNEEANILNRIQVDTNELGSMSSSIRGAEIGKNALTETKKGYPVLIGYDVQRFSINPTGAKISYDHKEFVRLQSFFKSDNILLLRRVSSVLVAAFSSLKIGFSKNLYGILPHHGIDNRYICALLNSSVLNFYYKRRFTTKKEQVFPEIQTYLFEQLPIKKGTTSEVRAITVISEILSIISSDISKARESLKSFYFCLLDATVYELYFPIEIKAANCDLIKHLTDIPEFQPEWSNEKKLSVVEEFYNTVSGSSHPIQIAIEKMKELEEIRIVEGRA